MTHSGEPANRRVFELVSLPSAPSVPQELANRLRRPGVPRDFLGGTRYRVLPQAIRREPPHDTIVAFGLGGQQKQFGVEIDTGAVVWEPTDVSPALFPVNATIDQFSECVRVVEAILAEPNDDFDLDDFERIASDVRHAIDAIDDAVFTGEHGGFWFEFYFDVQMGSY